MFVPRTPVTPRDEMVLQVVTVCRISTENQNEMSLDDQRALLEAWLKENFSGRYQLVTIQTRGSGEITDRPEIQQLEELVRTRRVDLILCEDLGRILRRVEVVHFCNIATDHGVRLIALNDSVDTHDPGWKEHSVYAAFRHEKYNADTSARITRTLRHRFIHGGINQFVIAGYRKPPGAKSDAEIEKNPGAAEVYERWFQILEDGGTYSDVADYLNEIEFKTGPFCRTLRWTCAMVSRITHNPILKGVRERNRKHSVRHNESGRRRCVKAPPGQLLTRECPHLAFIDPQRYDRLIARLRIRNAGYARKGDPHGKDPRADVPKKRTRWPGQHVRCGVCGGLFVFGAHGQKHRLMCTKAREHRCWVGASFDEDLARRKVLQAIWAEIEALPEFTPELREALELEVKRQNVSGAERLKALEHRKTRFVQRQTNIRNSLRELGPSSLIRGEVALLEEEEQALRLEESEVNTLLSQRLTLPPMEEIRHMLRQRLESVVKDSQDAARFLRRLLPEFVVTPVRLMDKGNVVLRASILIDFSAAWDSGLVASETLQRRCIVDLFEPPQFERYRTAVVRLRRLWKTEREIASQLGITVTACQKAAKLQRLMDCRQTDDAYVPVTDITLESGRLSRHRHPRFHQA